MTDWWLCPNTPSCGHGAVFHDTDGEADTPEYMCCIDECECGKENN